jgi:hypothetical protein
MVHSGTAEVEEQNAKEQWGRLSKINRKVNKNS